jgi:hypothetical protein
MTSFPAQGQSPPWGTQLLGHLNAKLDHFRTVEEFGVVGDGITDDTTNFQAALDSGGRAIFAGGTYKITAGLELQNDQIVFGLPKSMVAATSATNEPRIIFRPSGTDKVLFRNATGTIGNGVMDLALDLNHNSNAGVIFSQTYGNIAQRLIFYGTMRFGVIAERTYVCNLDALVFNGCSVRTANVFLGESNATTISRVHTSGFPNDVAECLYGIALSVSGSTNAVRDCVLQGNTIGIAGSSSGFTEIDNPYFENTLCPMRLGNIASSQGKYKVTGGIFIDPDASHSQYSSRGPLIILACNTVTLDTIAVEVTAVTASANGPWPIVLDSCEDLTLINPFHYGPSATIPARNLIYRRVAGSNTGITILASDYEKDDHHPTEIVLKNAGNYGSTCYGIRIDSGGSVVTSAYQPAIINNGSTDINALLLTNLPTGASLATVYGL